MLNSRELAYAKMSVDMDKLTAAVCESSSLTHSEREQAVCEPKIYRRLVHTIHSTVLSKEHELPESVHYTQL